MNADRCRWKIAFLSAFLCAYLPHPIPVFSQAIKILPSLIELSGPRSSQRIIVQASYPDGHQEQVKAILVVSNPKVAAVMKDTIVPKGDGETTLSYGTAKATIRVKHFDATVPWSFRNDVLSVMTKTGCNSGACHGAAAGKNGFHLTLRGYDPEADYTTLTRQYTGRRVVVGDPASSLMLLKPTFAITHGGGKRFAKDSLEARIFSEWIAAGAPPPAESDARVTSLSVYPASAALKPAGEQQILVLAHYSDGHVADATRWTKYSSTDEGIAAVDEAGLVKMRASGEAAVTVWYQSQVAFARLSVPYANRIAAATFDKAPRNNFIDDLVLAKLRTLHIAPATPASDAEFLRRLYLDAAGVLPTPDEAERFAIDTRRDKRQAAIAALLERPEFVDYWAYKWSDLLLVSSKKLSGNALWSYSNWIRESVAANKPWNRMVRELLTGTGSNLDNGALNYFVLHREPTDLTENFAKTFLGLSITCARCHNHPLEKWTQNDYYQMAALFSRVSMKGGGRAGEAIITNAIAGEVNHPRLGHALPPRPLDAGPLPANSEALHPGARLEYLARWTTSPDNPYFARAIVNRIWQNFMGRGLVDPPDDLRATNPASNEELLAALTGDFVDHGYDIRRLIVTIASSAAYQRSSETSPANAMDDRYYSHYLPHRLQAEVLLDAFSQISGVAEPFEGFQPGTRALELPDTQLSSYFLTAFGRPPRETPAHAERQSDSSMTQALHLLNGNTLNRKLAAPNSRIGQMIFLGLSDAEIVDHLYLAAFARRPTDQQRSQLLAPIAGLRDQRRAALEDLAWSLLTSKEFVFNH